MNQRGDLASVFLREFVRAIFVTLHPELSKQLNAADSSYSEDKAQFVQSKKLSRGFGVSESGIIKLPAFKPIARYSQFQSQNQGQFRGGRQGIPGVIPVPIPSYKIQQYFAKNKEWPTIVVPAKNAGGPMLPSIGSKVVSSAAKPKESTKLDSLVYLLSDPNVTSLECPGPGKPIVLNKSGNMENSSLVFSQEDIKNVTDEVSRKTGQKFDSGFVKAAIGNFIVSAVISEFVGTRFVMQKLPGGK